MSDLLFHPLGSDLGGLLLLTWWALLALTVLIALVVVVGVVYLVNRCCSAFWRGLTGRTPKELNP